MSTRYFKISPANKVVETEDYKFQFEPTYRFLSATVGTIAIEDKVQADALSGVAKENGVEEITTADYQAALQKKSTLNVNIVRHHARVTEKAGVVPVKANDAGETSSAVNSVDDLLTAPKEPEPLPEPKSLAQKKRRTRKPRAKKSS